jgi:hypothetical protein
MNQKLYIFDSMKKVLVILALCLGALGTQAQSISMSDLTNLATINITEAQNFLTSGKPFKEDYQQTVNGLDVRHFVGTTPASKPEKLVVGDGVRTSANNVLHTVTYTCTDPKYLFTLIDQAQSAELKKSFQGADQFNNIYIFDNFLYSVHIYVRTDNTGGIVKVEQKYYVE